MVLKRHGTIRKSAHRMGKKPTTGQLKDVVKAVKHLKVLEKNAMIGDYDYFGANNANSIVAAGTVHYLHPNVPGSYLTVPNNQKCNFKAIEIKGIIYIGDATFGTNAVRVALVQDMANEAANPTLFGTADSAAIYFNPGGANSAYYNVLANPLLNNSKRFKILYDKTFVLNGQTANGLGSAALPIYKTFHIKKRLSSNRTIEYDGQSGTVTDSSVGQLFLCYWCDNTLTGIGTMTVNSKLLLEHF